MVLLVDNGAAPSPSSPPPPWQRSAAPTSFGRPCARGRPWWLALLGGVALFAYGFVAAFQPDPNFGRILAAYGGVFVAGSLAWGVVFDGFRRDRLDLIGGTRLPQLAGTRGRS